MRVFVTGGNGFIGSVLVRRLLAAGYEVRCLLRPTSCRDRLAGLTYDVTLGDVRDRESLRTGARGCDGIIHVAGLAAWSDIESPLMPDVVVGGTRNVLDVARELGQRVVFVSSSVAVNGSAGPVLHDEESPNTLDLARYRYARAKVEAEGLCRRAAEAGLPVVVVCPCEVYGPNDTRLVTAGTLVDFARSSPVVVCDGGTSVVHVEDVAAGIAAAYERGRSGERYILGGENLTIKQMAQLALDILGKNSRLLVLPNGLIRPIARAGGALRVPLPFNPAVIPYATLYWFMSNAKAQRELGVTFRSARETLAPTLAWLKEAGHIAA
jgi:dihydroflavonol-4-reductase